MSDTPACSEPVDKYNRRRARLMRTLLSYPCPVPQGNLMSDTTTWFLVAITHSNVFNPDEVEAALGSALSNSQDLRDMANIWLPGLRKIATYGSNGDERIAYDPRLGPIVLQQAGHPEPQGGYLKADT